MTERMKAILRVTRQAKTQVDSQLQKMTDGMRSDYLASFQNAVAITRAVWQATSKQGQQSLFIYAGQDIKEQVYDSLWKLNLDCIPALLENDPLKTNNFQFELVTTNGDKPGSISHHSTEAFEDNLYLFGGTSGDNDSEHFYRFNTKTRVWSIINEKGDVPVTRDDHCSCVWNNKFLVFSGFVKGTRSNDLYAFDFASETWECLFKDTNARSEPPSFPEQRAASTMSVIGNLLYVFGGQDEDNNKLNDLWTFDLSTQTWELMETDDDFKPHSRTGMSSWVINDKFHIFGGILEVTKETNDIHQFDPVKKTWSLLQFEEEQHTQTIIQRQHTLAMAAKIMTKENASKKDSLKSTQLDVVSEEKTGKSMKPSESVATLHTKSRGSPKKRVFSQSPKRRIAQRKKKEVAEGEEGEPEKKQQERLSSPTSLTMSNTFIVKNADQSFDSYYSLMRRRKGGAHTEQRSKILPKYIPTARDGHSSVLFGDRMIVFGGDRHHMPFNDMYYLKITK